MFTERHEDRNQNDTTSDFFDVDFDFDHHKSSDVSVITNFTSQEEKLFGSPVFFESDEPQTTAPPAELAGPIEQLAKSGKPIDKALAEALNRIFSDDNDADTNKEIDAKAILKLIERNKPPLDKEALLALMTKSPYLNGRHAVLEMNDDEKSQKAVEILAKLLKSADPLDTKAADSVIHLLSNTQPAHEKLSKEIVKMLNGKRTDQNEAIELLKSPLDLSSAEKMLNLSRKATATQTNEVKALLKSSDQKDSDAAIGLIELFDQSPLVFSRAVTSLEKQEQRDRVLNIARICKVAEEVERMLNLVDDPKNHRAIDVLFAKTEITKPIINLLVSGFNEDKNLGANLLARLGKDEQSIKDVFSILSIEDAGDAKRLVALLDDPDTAPGIRTLLSQRQSPDKTVRQTADDMLTLVVANNFGKFDLLVETLQTDYALATKIFGIVDRPETFVAVQALLSSKNPEDKTTATGILNVANAGNEGADIASLLVSLRSSHADIVKKTASRLAQLKPEELVTIAKAAVKTESLMSAVTLLRMLDTEKPEVTKKIIQELLTGSPDQQHQTSVYLSSFGIGKDPLPQGVLLQKMLNNPDEKDIAKAILSNAEVGNPANLMRLMENFQAPADVPLRRQMNKIAVNDPALAKALIRSDFTRGELGTFLEIYGEPGRATAATVLRQMIVDNENVKNLLRMMDPARPDTHKLGFSLLSMLNTPAKDVKLDPAKAQSESYFTHKDQPPERRTARLMLSSGLNDNSLNIANRELQNGSEQAIELANQLFRLAAANPKIINSIDKIYTGLQSSDAAVKNSAQLMLKFLDRQPVAAVELFQLTKPGDPDFAKIAAIADTPEKMKAVVDIFRRRADRNPVTDENAMIRSLPDVAASELIYSMNYPATAGDAKYVVEMLAKPETRDKAIELIQACGARQNGVKLIPLLNPGSDASPEAKARAQRLHGLLDDRSASSRQALENLSNIIFNDTVEENVKKSIVQMLGSAKDADRAISVLKTFTSSGACQGMFMLMETPDHADAKRAVDEILASAKARDRVNIEGFLAKLSPGLDSSDFLLPLLKDRTTKEFAKQIIRSVDRFDYPTIKTMVEKKDTKEMLQDFMDVLRQHPDSRDAVTSLLGQPIGEIREMHQILSNADVKDIGLQILELLSSIETPDIILGRSIQSLLASRDPITAAYARDIVKRYRSTENEMELRFLMELASMDADSGNKIEKKLNQPGMEVARRLALEIGPLALRSWVITNRQDDVWRMMNDTRYHEQIRKKIK